MVDSTCYLPNADNTTWREMGTGKQAKKGDHAEIQAYNAASPGATVQVAMFIQDGAPCEVCHPKFRELSRAGGKSFIFCISRGGYVIHLDTAAGDQLGGMHLPLDAGPRKKLLAEVLHNRWIKLDDDHLPAVLYFHAGTVFLDARPHNFPACPPLLAGYG